MTTHFKGFDFIPEHIADMREWLSCCTFADEVDFESLTPLEVINGVRAHWDGGLFEYVISQEILPEVMNRIYTVDGNNVQLANFLTTNLFSKDVMPIKRKDAYAVVMLNIGECITVGLVEVCRVN